MAMAQWCAGPISHTLPPTSTFPRSAHPSASYDDDDRTTHAMAAPLHVDGGPVSLQPQPSRPYSIDLSLELERQLDAESMPNSPLPNTADPPEPPSLDVNILASIVTNLRLSLADVTRERDTLQDKLNQAMSHQEGVKETLQHVTDKCIRLETELAAAHDKHKDDEDAIAMLRSKVEESR